uniref:Lipocalin/cytosolic fatty-acid binding domain-containing protein n=1 Tax=Amblyomma maculatum TaxID=34609 RepID=G3MKE9_AMBMU
MDPGRHIWSFEESPEAKLLLCTSDLPTKISDKEVFFTRYTQDSTGNAVLRLKGTFLDFHPEEGPTIMLVGKEDGSPPFQSELLVYQDENNSCGVFLVHALTPIIEDCHPNVPSSLCELRDTSNTTQAAQSSDCYSTFLHICKPRGNHVNAVPQEQWNHFGSKSSYGDRCKPVPELLPNA